MRDRDLTDQWKLGGVEVPRRVQEFRVTLDCTILAVTQAKSMLKVLHIPNTADLRRVLDSGHFYTTTSHAGTPTECMLAIFSSAVVLFAANSGQPDAQSAQARIR